MDMKYFLKVCRNKNEFTTEEIDRHLKVLTDEELNKYQDTLEQYSLELSGYDHINAYYTLKLKLLKEIP